MSGFRKSTVVALLATVFLSMGTGAALAALREVPAGGGTWRYGTQNGTAHSQYLHNTFCHTATVARKNTSVKDSEKADPRIWARASLADSPFHVEESFYNRC
ncbi:lactococcin 972 family bacteriocin [Nocardiopsis sp. CC223A]|uniref:lactococcin 972 family bacteriocin n=1 Tax=Nocardiopsis sp. CC223A TaxID=3044051 RepID=UPI00278C1AA1|nr:lactococcin 972 family bacteriocin [Nocardiopsis sp. CC223A]